MPDRLLSIDDNKSDAIMADSGPLISIFFARNDIPSIAAFEQNAFRGGSLVKFVGSIKRKVFSNIMSLTNLPCMCLGALRVFYNEPLRVDTFTLFCLLK